MQRLRSWIDYYFDKINSDDGSYFVYYGDEYDNAAKLVVNNGSGNFQLIIKTASHV